ncbi:hypothetical protein T4D_8391 [Trichinella pseudospiralis]|uniref:Uncharacterized protein n=1 Tax=Trichinella pseudospiralis TaxID=6337 RepID=A0A0V1FT75_TRIPS|nr:hypothetical protein T4D_8391 [Trichinella pseudospiralis]
MDILEFGIQISGPAVGTKNADIVGKLIVIGHNHAAFHGHNVVGEEERKGACQAERSHMTTSIVLVANFHNSIHVRHIAHQVDNEERFRLRADRFFHNFRRRVQSDRINVHQLNIQIGQHRHQNLIPGIQHFARSHGQRHRAEQISRRTAVHHHRMTDAYCFGKILLEALHLGTHGVHHFIHTIRWYAQWMPNPVHLMLPITISIYNGVHFVRRFTFIQIQFGHIRRKNDFTICNRTTIPAVMPNIVKVNVCSVVQNWQVTQGRADH